VFYFFKKGTDTITCEVPRTAVVKRQFPIPNSQFPIPNPDPDPGPGPRIPYSGPRIPDPRIANFDD
jgi:hypothetical protein